MSELKRATPGDHWRPDIDGLRAVAVVAVVLYHYEFSAFSGGFVGVDAFFVISGYLITSLIYREMMQGTFSLVLFYERRVRRIVPALSVVLLAATLASFFLLLPKDFSLFSKSLVATALFSSNIEFWRESGYFDVAAKTKPLLHTWSLAIEEQFYLVFPLLLFCLRGLRKGAIAGSVLAITLLSFVGCVWLTSRAATSAFYLAPVRAWELLLGSLLALTPLPRPTSRLYSTGMALLGLGLIVFAMVCFTAETPFPGYNAAVPCVGTVLLIYAGSARRSMVNRALEYGPIVLVGLISYSLYLWHWPVLVFANYYAVSGLSLLEKVGFIGASVGLAYCSWRYVERPFRGRTGAMDRRLLFATAAGVGAITVATGIAVNVCEGMPWRFPAPMRALSAASGDYRQPTRCLADAPSELIAAHLCKIGPDSAGKPDFLVWGDSLSYAELPGIERAAATVARTGLSAERSGCPPLLGVERNSHDCFDFNQAAFRAAVQPGIKHVILISRWALNAEGSRYGREPGGRVVLSDARGAGGHGAGDNHVEFARGLERTVRELRSAGKSVTIVESTPEIGWNVPTVLARFWLLHRAPRIAPTMPQYLARQSFVIETISALRRRYGVGVIEPHSVLCTRDECPVVQGSNVLYSDDHHITPYAAMKLTPLFVADLIQDHR